MPAPAPPVNQWTRDDLAKRTDQLVRANTRWTSEQRADPAQALIQIFARMADQVIERLNQMPEKHFRAFLDLIGVQIGPPRSARVPLTFQLVEGAAGNIRVPVATRAAAKPPETAAATGQAEEQPAIDASSEPIIFETSQELVLTPARLVAVLVRDPKKDTYADYSDRTTGAGIQRAMFKGDIPMSHMLYLACDELLASSPPGSGLPEQFLPRDITVLISSPAAQQFADLAIDWSTWDEKTQQWIKLPNQATVADGTYRVEFAHLPLLQQTDVDGQRAAWLRARLEQLLRPENTCPAITAIQLQVRPHCANLSPDLGFANEAALDLTKDAFPLGEQPGLSASFYFTHTQLFARPGAAVELAVALSNPRMPRLVYPVPPVKPAPRLRLAWEYWDGRQWKPLLRDHPLNGAPMPAELLVEPISIAVANAEVTFTGALPPEHKITIQKQLWDEVEDLSAPETDDETDEWKTTIRKLDPGMHAYLITAQRDDVVQGQRWALAYNPLDQPEPTPVTLTLEPTAENLQWQARVKTTTNRPVLVRNSQSAIDFRGSSAEAGEFAEVIELQPGRNDVLALIFDDDGKPAGATITTMVLDDTGAPVEGVGAGLPDGFDGTWGLTRSGTLRFTLPSDAQPSLVNGQSSVWVRARVITGSYGSQGGYEPMLDDKGKQKVDKTTGLPLYKFVPASFRPPSIQSALLRYLFLPRPFTAAISENDFTLVDHSAAARAGTSAFTPFAQSKEPCPTLYLGFDRPLDNQPIALFFGLKPSEPIQARFEWWYVAREALAQAPSWCELPIAADETDGFSQSDLVKFVAPADLASMRDFGKELYWLRVRKLPAADEGNDAPAGALVERQAEADAPFVEHILTNTTWAVQCQGIYDEVLGSSNGEAGQIFETNYTPIIADPDTDAGESPADVAAIAAGRRHALHLEVAEHLSEDDLERLQTAGLAVTRNLKGTFNDYWVRWCEVADFYTSEANDRHYILDRLTGEIRFGTGIQGMRPPQGIDNIRLSRYHWGGGIRGNVGAGSVVQLLTTLPFIGGVTNYVAASGGADHETIERVEERGPKLLRHRDRAVTFEDFEDLAFQASPDVARAIAVNPDPTGYNHNPRGRVRLIILPASQEAQPRPSPQLLRTIETYLAVRCAAAVQLQVGAVAPEEWVPVSIRVTVAATSFEQQATLKETIEAALRRFLHPLNGGFAQKGWNFGQRPRKSDVYRLLEAIEGVDHVQSLEICPAEYPAVFLIYSGEHTVILR